MSHPSSNRLVIGLAAAAAFGLGSTWWLHNAPAPGLPAAPQAGVAAAAALPLRPGVQAAGVDISTGALMAIRLPDADGKAHTLAEWQGKPMVINFWATWCDPCREELPLLGKLAQAPANADAVVVVGVALDSADSVRTFLHTQPLGFPVLVDQDSVGEKLAARLGDASGSLPFTAIVDRNGVVVETRLGPWKAGELDARLALLRAP